MPRMEIELTSARDDETFTWRAAGARQPRGVVPVSLLPGGSKVGDVLRVEAEVEIDGINILQVIPRKEKAPVAGRIEVIGPPKPTAGVTTVLAEKRGGRGPRDFEDGGRRRGPREGGDRERGRGRPGDAAGRPERRDGERRDRPGFGDRARSGVRSARAERPESRTGESRPPRPPRPDGIERAPGRGTGERRPAAAADRQPARKGPHRLEPGTKHRDALFETLSPEQRPIAERLAVGGLPAVRRALSEEQERATAEGRPSMAGEPLLVMAEQLLPDVRAAVWLDRAEAAALHIDQLGLRDLRATVAAAEPKTEQSRELQRTLKEGLERRVTKLRTDWETHLRQALDDGRVLQALRLSARPPEPTARFPATLVPTLAGQAGAAMTAETSAERWLALLEAAVASPVRRQVKPAGMPEDPTGEVANQARLAASRIPALASLLGMAMPPPPKPLPGERPAPRRVRPPRPVARTPRPRPAAAQSDATRAPAAGVEPQPAAEPTAAEAPPAEAEPQTEATGETAADESEAPTDQP